MYNKWIKNTVITILFAFKTIEAEAKMYNLIAENYSSIFPLEGEKLSFIGSYCNTKDMRILDIGCATGDLAIELAKQGFAVSGIDLNRKMIEIAKERIRDKDISVDFKVLNMMDLSADEKYDCVLCLGNTLPHITTWKDLNGFVELLYKVLNKNGYFIFQILNYDKILKDKKIEFNRIESREYIFEREYPEIGEDGIIFRIKYYDKITHEEYADSTKLLPIRKNKILECLSRNGFADAECFSGYKKTKCGADDFYNVYAARRK